MAAGTFNLYTRNFGRMNIDEIVAATVKIALLSSSYTPDFDETSGHRVLADLSNEIANGNGYTTGGLTLTTLTKTAIANGFKFSSDNAVWTASGTGIPAWRHAVMYVSGSLWSLTSPLIGSFIGDTTPADIPLTTAGNTLTLNVPSDGWFDVS